jgi:hypothetical protein
MTRTHQQIAEGLQEILASSYPDIEIRVVPFAADPARPAIYFTDPKFALIYPQQRFHYLRHLIPVEYQNQYLANSVWFELAPGEEPEDLVYPDEELIESIAEDVMHCLNKTSFFAALDDRLIPSEASQPRALCYGDYRISKSILPTKGFSEPEYFEIFHVLMARGGYCDCEILYNVAEESRLRSEYWKTRAAGGSPYDPHIGT